MSIATARSVLLALASFGCGAAAVHTASSASAEPSGDAMATTSPAPTTPPTASVLVRRNASGQNNAVEVTPPAPDGTVRLVFGGATTEVPLSKTGVTLGCSRAAFHLWTGTNQGTCTANPIAGTATCVDGPNTATAACATGCSSTSGAGDCTQS